MEELRIRIEPNCENDIENIEEFLLSFCSTQIETFMFQGHSIKIQNENLDSEGQYSSYFEVFPCFNYFYGLRYVMSKATKYINIYKILLSSKEFSAILRAAKHVEKLKFIDCKILTDEEYELGQMEGWQIEFLQVGYIIRVYKHSRDYEDSWMKIYLSIVCCPNLLRSLRHLIFNCGGEMKKKLLSKAKEILGNDYDILMPRFECF